MTTQKVQNIREISAHILASQNAEIDAKKMMEDCRRWGNLITYNAGMNGRDGELTEAERAKRGFFFDVANKFESLLLTKNRYINTLEEKCQAHIEFIHKSLEPMQKIKQMEHDLEETLNKNGIYTPTNTENDGK